jgi:hypothetical protein
MLIDYEVAHKALTPYYDTLWNIVSSGWNDWKGDHISSEYKMSFSDRTRACIINDRMRYGALRTTESDSSIQCVIHQQMFVLVITPSNLNGCIGIRLKKLSADGLSRNQQTKQVRDFKEQMLLPAIAADYHLEVGYVIDEFGHDLKSIDLVCPSGRGIYWKSEIAPKSSLQKPHIIEQDLFNDVVVTRKNIIGEKGEDTGTS